LSVALSCSCGAVAGELLEPERVTRVVCHCRGCQAYARFLGRPELVDEIGGTDVYQVTPDQVRISRGVDRVRCVRQTPKGGLRWYADCCKTPIVTSLDKPGVPWMGMPHLFVDAEDTRDAGFGPVEFRIHGEAARGPAPEVHPSGPPGLVVKAMGRTIRDMFKGRARPHPVFPDGEPLVPYVLLTDEERAEIGLP